MNKILILVFVFTVILLGIDAFYFLPQKQPSVVKLPPKQVNVPTKTSGFSTVQFIDILSSNINGITKQKVEQLANISGSTELTLTNPSISPELKAQIATLSSEFASSVSSPPSTIKVLAGRFKNWSGQTLVLDQNKKEVSVDFPQEGARFLINNAGKVQIASLWINKLVSDGLINQYVKPNDYVLVMYVTDKSSHLFAGSRMVVYK